MKYLLPLLIILSSLSIEAQVAGWWEYPDFDGKVVHLNRTSDGGYIFGTREQSSIFFEYPTAIVHIDAIGDTQWTVPTDFLPANSGHLLYLEEIDGGGYQAIYHTNDSGVYTILLINLDSNGNIISQVENEEETAEVDWDIQKDGEGNFYFMHGSDNSLMKTDSNLSVIWKTELPELTSSYGGESVELEDTTVLVIAHGGPWSGGYDDIYRYRVDQDDGTILEETNIDNLDHYTITMPREDGFWLIGAKSAQSPAVTLYNYQYNEEGELLNNLPYLITNSEPLPVDATNGSSATGAIDQLLLQNGHTAILAYWQYTYIPFGSDVGTSIRTNRLLILDESGFPITNIDLTFDYDFVPTSLEESADGQLLIGGVKNDQASIFIWDIDSSDNLMIAPKMYLMGALINSVDELMRDDLRENNWIPLTEPYTALSGFEHMGNGGGENIMAEVLSTEGSNAIVDWVFIELRSATDPSQVLATRSALLQRDGDVVDTDGTSAININELDAGDYFMAVRHRNHLGAMTPTAISLSNEQTEVDFTTMIAWGENAQVEAGPNYALWSGNANIDQQVIFQGLNNDINSIFFEVLTAPENTEGFANYAYEGYQAGDLDMNGISIYQGVGNELNLLFFNIATHPNNPSNIANYIIQEQLPN